MSCASRSRPRRLLLVGAVVVRLPVTFRIRTLPLRSDLLLTALVFVVAIGTLQPPPKGLGGCVGAAAFPETHVRDEPALCQQKIVLNLATVNVSLSIVDMRACRASCGFISQFLISNHATNHRVPLILVILQQLFVNFFVCSRLQQPFVAPDCVEAPVVQITIFPMGRRTTNMTDPHHHQQTVESVP